MILYEIENGLDEEYINVVKERISKFPQLMQDMLSDTYTKFCIVRKIPNATGDYVYGKFVWPNTIYLQVSGQPLKAFHRTIAHECAHFIDNLITADYYDYSEVAEEFLTSLNSERERIENCYPIIKEGYPEYYFSGETFARVSTVSLTPDLKPYPYCNSTSLSSEIPRTLEAVDEFYRELPKIYKQYSIKTRNKLIKAFGRELSTSVAFQYMLFEKKSFNVYNSNKNSFIIAKAFPENNYELILGKVYIKNGHIYNSRNEDCIALLKEFYKQNIEKYRREFYYIWVFERLWCY